ncbi:MAG: hypothetical protein RNU03_20945 [Candidatus Sedimenticola sp. (ex Thyasira tokunagai)]
MATTSTVYLVWPVCWIYGWGNGSITAMDVTWDGETINIWCGRLMVLSSGQLVEEHYVMRNLARCYPARQTPPVPPLPHDPPLSCRIPVTTIQPRPGWIDTLEAATHLPFHHELVGTWAVDGEAVKALQPTEHFSWQQESNKQESGSWSVQAARLTIQEHEAKECATYLILEYSSEYAYTPGNYRTAGELSENKTSSAVKSIQVGPWESWKAEGKENVLVMGVIVFVLVFGHVNA